MTAKQDNQRAALARLIKIAKGDTGQSRRVADFLLAWWNAGSCGSFDLTWRDRRGFLLWLPSVMQEFSD
ncbi:DUF7673 family protein, partial [Acetobacter pasteurianus]